MNSLWPIALVCLLTALEIYGLETTLSIPYRVVRGPTLREVQHLKIMMQTKLVIKVDADIYGDLLALVEDDSVLKEDDSVLKEDDSVFKSIFEVKRGNQIMGTVYYDSNKYLVWESENHNSRRLFVTPRDTDGYNLRAPSISLYMENIHEMTGGTHKDFKLKLTATYSENGGHEVPWTVHLTPRLTFSLNYKYATFQSAGRLGKLRNKQWNIANDKSGSNTNSLQFVCGPSKSVQLVLNEDNTLQDDTQRDDKLSDISKMRVVAFVVKKGIAKYSLVKGNTKYFLGKEKFCTLYVKSEDYEIHFPWLGRKHVNVARKDTKPRSGYRLFTSSLKEVLVPDEKEH